MYIKEYAEPIAYSDIFKTAEPVSDTTEEQFMHILNLIYADSDIFITLAYLGKQCFTHIQAYLQSYAYCSGVAGPFLGRVRFSKFRTGLLKYYMLNLISDLFKVPSCGYMCK